MSDPLLDDLAELKERVERARPDSGEFHAAVKQYNQVLELALVGMKRPLDPKYELPDELILDDYQELKSEWRTKGPYTIRRLVEDRDVVAFVLVQAVRRRGELVVVDPIETYKGTLEKRAEIDVPRSWMPRPWFTKGERVLLFAVRDGEGLSAPGTKGRMPICARGGEDCVECWGSDSDFWPAIEAVSLEGEKTMVQWSVLRPLLKAWGSSR